ncbi:gene transfer agent family protein [Parerythrobacter lacustris]|uniref:Gene transfer agent family protein n=1 Tax=Parerythrobacter lacustris TaxID=2969984 RepID=A0ABT1XRI5_9SPHN|nr:gene transfer agent family protein [Parerythrobacter lacustris]MCR2834261.1 gene transfer agent family protein [Parerythrobacter lacustris]
MSETANPHRGEASVEIQGRALVLRPSFTALVAAEQELGPLFALVERAAEGRLSLAEMVALFWHCLADPGAMTRDAFAEGVTALGLAPCAKPLRALLGQILQGTA